jgi:hypothetical protein
MSTIRLRCVLFIMIGLSCQRISAQDTAKTIFVIDQELGEIIDSTEKANYHLFPFCSSKDFRQARFFRLGDSTYTLSIEIKDGSTREFPYSGKDMLETRRLISRLYGSPDPPKAPLSREERKALSLKKKPAMNAIYTELGGSVGAPVSLNYERVYFTDNLWFMARLGCGYHNETVTDVISYYGKNTEYGRFSVLQTVFGGGIVTSGWRNHFEVSGGLVYNFTSNRDPADSYPSYGTFQLQAAYRYQKKCSSFFFKAGIGTHVDNYQHNLFGTIFPLPLISMGGSF